MRLQIAAAIGSTLWALGIWLLGPALLAHLAHAELHFVGGTLLGAPCDIALGFALLSVAPRFLPAFRVALHLLLTLSFAALVAYACSLAELVAFPISPTRSVFLLAMLTVLALVPAAIFVKSTLRGEKLRYRVFFQMASFGWISLVALPALALEHDPFAKLDFGAPRTLALLPATLLLGFASSAVHDFMTLGQGTPLPVDPPKRLVTAGLYHYLANPMQFFMSLAMMCIALAIRSPWLAAGTGTIVVFSIGIGRLEEWLSLRKRFGEEYASYRGRTRLWRPHWAASPPVATLRFNPESPIQSKFAGWLGRRAKLRLEPGKWELVENEISCTGISAVARALERIHFGWALCASLIRQLRW